MQPTSTEERCSQVEAILDAFESAWTHGATPDIEAYVVHQDASADPATRRQLLAELVVIDLWHRWRLAAAGPRPSGDKPAGPRVQDYLAHFSELGPRDVLPLVVIEEEYRARRQWGDQPEPEEYRKEFSSRWSELAPRLAAIDTEFADRDAAFTLRRSAAPAASSQGSAEPAADDPMPQRIGKYHVVALVDRGAQATVYRAIHPGLAKEVVIKLSRYPLSDEVREPSRLLAEAKVLAELDHPNLARVYDVDLFEGRPYIVMEYIRGQNLQWHAQQRPFAAKQAAAFVAKIARALVAPHARGIVHQDIKPGNILVDEMGEPRLIDFGLARLRPGWGEQIREPGTIVGTLRYIAPEQARGESGRIGPASDQFAIGGVLYFLLTGAAPFSGEDLSQCLARAQRCDFDAGALRRARVPRALQAICLRAMQAQPGDRYPSVEVLAAALERFAAGRGRRRGAWLVLGVVCALAALAGLRFLLPAGSKHVTEAISNDRQIHPEMALLGRSLRHDFRLKVTISGGNSTCEPLSAQGVWKAIVDEGQAVTFRMDVERECYAGIWHVAQRDGVRQLFPNANDQDHFLSPDRPRFIPGSANYSIRVTPAEGLEYLHVVASTRRWESLYGQQHGAYVVFATPEERAQWERRVRGVCLDSTPEAAVAEQLILLEVRPAAQRATTPAKPPAATSIHPAAERNALATQRDALSAEFKTASDRRDQAKMVAVGQRLVDATAKLEGTSHSEYFAVLNNLAEAYQAQGAYAQASQLLDQVLASRRRLQGEHHPDYAIALNNLAGLYQAIGDYARAERLLCQSLDIYRAQGTQTPEYVTAVNNLAGIYYLQGHYSAAKPLFQQAIAVRKTTLGENDPDYATSVNNLAAVEEALGDSKTAADLYQQALVIRQRVLGPTHPAYAASLNNLAMLYRAQGDFARAEPLARQVVDLRRQIFGKQHPDYAAALNNLAVLYRSQGDCERAAPLYEEALAVQRRLLRETAAMLPPRQHLTLIAALRRTLDGYLSVTSRLSGRESSAWQQVLHWKGRVFARQRLTATHAELASQRALLQRTTARLAELVFDAKAAGPDIWQHELMECAQDKERLEAELSRHSMENEADDGSISVQQWCGALPPGTALVDLLEYGLTVPPTPGPSPKATAQAAPVRSLVAFVLRADRPLVRVELGPIGPIEELIGVWRRTCGAQGLGAQAGQRLRELLWLPLEKHLDQASIVLVSPDGTLARFPWAALPGTKPGSFLLEERALAVISVPQALPDLMAQQAAVPDLRRPTLLLVGEVDYRATHGTAAAPALPAGAVTPTLGPAKAFGLEFTPLDSTRGEVLSIRDSFEQAFPDGRATMLRGGSARETDLRAAVSVARFLHVATHGFFIPPSSEPAHSDWLAQASRAGAPGEPAHASARILGDVTQLYPGLLSGIALAGANEPPQSPWDDGILTAEEVATLDLGKLDLAVLSACETGLGTVADGEGVLGLQRAFQLAGARSVIASLWRVGDEATRHLMEAFYENLWGKRLGRLESLRQAQLSVLHNGGPRGMVAVSADEDAPARTPPFAWAGFVLSGDWR